jgi:hypothetical protein
MNAWCRRLSLRTCAPANVLRLPGHAPQWVHAKADFMNLPVAKSEFVTGRGAVVISD